MADKKISQLPQINALSGSSIIVPLVHDSTTQKMELGAFASYVSQWSAKTGSANTFSGTQTFSGNVNVAGNVNVNGRLTVHEIVANYETSSILFSTGSTKLGDQISDKHEFTGSTNITGSLFYNDVLIANIDSNTVFKLQQATASIHFATQSLNTQTGSQDLVNGGISSVTGSINTTTSSFDLVFLGISSFTGSLNSLTGSYATTGSNTFRGNQNITGSLSISAGEFNVITGSGNMTSSLIFDHTQNDGVTLGLRHNDRLSLADHTFNTQVWAGGVYTTFVRNGTPYSILNVEAFDDNKIYLYRDVRLYNKSLVIDNNLTVQKGVVIGSGSLSIQRGQFDVVSGSGALTSSLSFTHTEVDPITGDGTLALRYRNNDVGPENNAWKFVATDNGVQVRYDQYTTSNKMLFSVSSFGSNFDKLLIWRDARLYGTGLTVDDSLLVKGVITGSILATNGVVSSSNQLFELNGQTGSQQNLNAQIGIATSSLNSVSASLIGITNALMGFTASLDSTYATDAQLYQLYTATASLNIATGSIKDELAGLESYTASLKAAAIVSSSTQIQNYNLFALDANVAVKTSGSTLYSTSPSTTNFSQVNSLFLGGGAGQDATSADSSIFLGYNAGIQATAAQESFFAGNTAGGYATNALRSNFIGISAGGAATNASNANFIGYGVGQSATNASYANFIGSNAGFIATNATYANFIGGSAGQNATNASYSNFIGNFTGDGAANASYSNLFGFSAGKKVFGNGIGANNIIIGTNITLENDRRDSINFGGIIFATGSYRTTSGNSYSGSVGYGKVGINKVLPSFELDISGSVGVTGSLKVSDGITGSLYSTNGVISSSNQLFELNIQTGSQDSVNFNISVVTSSIDAHILKQAIQTGSQDLVNLGISTYTGSQNVINTSVDAHILKQSTQTGSQDLVNLGISTFTGSLRSEVNLIEAYTASLKAVAIVSSSQQITNYYKFAETASANTFYGEQSITGSLLVMGSSKFNTGANTNILLSNDSIDTAYNIVSLNGTRTKGSYAGIAGGGTGDNKLYLNSGDAVVIQTGGTFAQQVTINSIGGANFAGAVTASNFKVPSGGGLDFSATSNGSGTTSSELLNDYEEGTWTPVLADASSGGNAATITGDSHGVYTKIGRVVYFRFSVILSSKASMTAGNEVFVQGFPFTSQTIAGNWYNPSAAIIRNVTFTGYVQFHQVPASTYGYFRENVSNATGDNIIVSDLTDSAAMQVSGFYFV